MCVVWTKTCTKLLKISLSTRESFVIQRNRQCCLISSLEHSRFSVSRFQPKHVKSKLKQKSKKTHRFQFKSFLRTMMPRSIEAVFVQKELQGSTVTLVMEWPKTYSGCLLKWTKSLSQCLTQKTHNTALIKSQLLAQPLNFPKKPIVTQHIIKICRLAQTSHQPLPKT